jgi:hypothetical protein
MSEESRVSSEWLVIIGVSLKVSPSLPDIEREVDNGTSTDSARCSQAILSVL